MATTINVKIAVKETPMKKPKIQPTRPAPRHKTAVSEAVNGFPLVRLR